jgi:hypothetical protein
MKVDEDEKNGGMKIESNVVIGCGTEAKARRICS